MTPLTDPGAVQVSEDGLDQMRRVHQQHLEGLSGAVSLAEEMAQSLRSANPFGSGADGAGAYQSSRALTDALLAAVQRERDNLEKLWGNFRTWGELVADIDLGAAESIGNAMPEGGR